MIDNADIRWEQRFYNFKKAYEQLHKFSMQTELNDLEKQGFIKAFEYTFELSWKTLQDLLKENGYVGIVGPKPVIEQSFQDSYISDGRAWMRMLKSRNLASHTYDEETAKDIEKSIRDEYLQLLRQLKARLDLELKGK